MSKKLIRNCAAISIGTLILGIILFVASSSGTTTTGAGSVGFLVAVLCLIVCFITGAMSYFGALVKTARMRRMGWFVGILLFGVTGALIYGLLGPETQVSNEAMSSFLYRSYKQTKKIVN